MEFQITLTNVLVTLFYIIPGFILRKAKIVSYVGYYRDYAIFELDNGLFARVDLRPELRWADTVPYFEACYREGIDPLQEKLPEEEIRRLAAIWEECGI